MSETETENEPTPTKDTSAVPERAPEPVTPPKPAVPHTRRPLWPVFFILGFLALAAGEGYLWSLTQAASGQAAAQATPLAVLQAQVADLRAQAAQAQPAADSVGVQANLGVKFAALAAQVNALQAQVAVDHGTLSTLQENSTNLSQLSARITRLNQLETARMALDGGQALGNIPNAPPALAAFATNPPPSEAQLRLDFPAVARRAEAASIAGADRGTFWSRVLARLESLVTVSEGSHVLLGAPAAGVLIQAQARLDAGDLAGAVARLDTLDETTQQAMQPWLGQAQALLAARVALITLAGQN